MTLSKNVKDYLEREPKFRERKNKDRGIINLLMKKYPEIRRAVETQEIRKETITAMVQDYASMDRAWRQVLERNEHLRGADYAEKVKLEQEKQIELGYTPGFYRDVKKLRNI